MNKQVAPDTAGAAQSCGRRLLEIIKPALASAGRAVIAVSGGSTPKLMFAELAQHEFPWENVHLFFVDERAVPPTDPNSNYKLALDNFITPARFPKRNVHRIHGEIDPDQAAKRYRDELEEFFQLHRGALPVFDAIHFGLGGEGHTASIFPGDAHIDDRAGLATAAFVPALPHWRVTMLPGVLLAARHKLMLVAGADKNPVLKEVFGGDYDPWKYPIQLFAREGENVEWFLDEAAAAGL
jgi:6-phosphogluconolactonase